jgi:hypothetical protein
MACFDRLLVLLTLTELSIGCVEPGHLLRMQKLGGPVACSISDHL